MTGTKVEPKVVHATCVVERSFAKPPLIVFAALSDPSKVQRWMGGGSRELEDFLVEFKEGGRQVAKYRMGPESPIAGSVILNEGRYQQIVLGERIVIASTMKRDGKMFSSSQVTFELVETETGTDLILTHQGAFFEGADGPAMREQGWRKLMENLAAVVSGQ
ncbi:MAG: SRPBCC domain-containing protein [Terracidiphilus sp.]